MYMYQPRTLFFFFFLNKVASQHTVPPYPVPWELGYKTNWDLFCPEPLARSDARWLQLFADPAQLFMYNKTTKKCI